MLKKMMVLGLGAVLVVSLSACSENNEIKEYEKDKDVATLIEQDNLTNNAPEKVDETVPKDTTSNESEENEKDIEVVEIERYKKEDGLAKADIHVFELKNLKDINLQAELNNKLKKEAYELIEHHKDLSEDAFADSYIAFNYSVVRNDEKIFTLCVVRAEDRPQVATYYNIDKDSGKLMKLEDFYGENENYIDYIANYIVERCQERNKAEGYNLYDLATFENIKEYQNLDNFYINENGNLVISFPRYAIASLTAGIVEIELGDDLTFNDLEKANEVEEDKLQKNVVGKWKPVSAKDKNGEEISLQYIWGTGIKYGGTLNIYKDGSYTEYIGIYAETDYLEGTWEENTDKVVLTSKTNDKKYITILDKDKLEVDDGEYIVRFERDNN